jgi:Ca-activated chloride channel family protein
VIATAADSIGTLQERLTSKPPQGHTALFDAIYVAVAKLRTARYQRRALPIISDGGDNKSRYTRACCLPSRAPSTLHTALELISTGI